MNLAHNHDVVLVSINHRLNVLGATYLGEVAGPAFASSGSVGMLDIVASLQWVRENIERFGGDANLVTIFGQSGGGRKVATLMAIPRRRACITAPSSKAGLPCGSPNSEDAIEETNLLLREFGLRAQSGARTAKRSR